MRILSVFVSAAIFSALLMAFGAGNAQGIGEYPNGELLMDASWLEANLGSNDFHIVDMREDNFEDGHIPGAVNIKGYQALVHPDHEVSNFLVDADHFAEIMSEAGIDHNSDILIYDEGEGLSAARLFYALEYYGHEGHVRLLNGGFSSWKGSDLPLSSEPSEANPAEYKANVQEELQCDLSFITENIDSDDVVIFDARSREEFTGQERRAERSGHIPGAVNIEWSEALQDNDIPYFKSAEEISAMLSDKGITPDKEVIPHCQSNVRGSHVYFTLRLMGYDSVKPYEGSWEEYGNNPDVPVGQ